MNSFWQLKPIANDQLLAALSTKCPIVSSAPAYQSEAIALKLVALLQEDVPVEDATDIYNTIIEFIQTTDQLEELDTHSCRNILYVFALSDSGLDSAPAPGKYVVFMLDIKITVTHK